ncbi:MAG: HRDC domain-containing protein, partial [Desulfovibrionales bacterium]|nr:HRDC domain-containing protein [Desulfovibrionales bacterium]
LPHAELPSYPKSSMPRKTPAVQKRIKQLKKMREKKSESLGMEQGFLINNALITHISLENPDSLSALREMPNMRQWQMEVLGEDILNALGHA